MRSNSWLMWSYGCHYWVFESIFPELVIVVVHNHNWLGLLIIYSLSYIWRYQYMWNYFRFIWIYLFWSYIFIMTFHSLGWTICYINVLQFFFKKRFNMFIHHVNVIYFPKTNSNCLSDQFPEFSCTFSPHYSALIGSMW